MSSSLDEHSRNDSLSEDNECLKFNTNRLKKPKGKKGHDADHSSEKEETDQSSSSKDVLKSITRNDITTTEGDTTEINNDYKVEDFIDSVIDDDLEKSYDEV